MRLNILNPAMAALCVGLLLPTSSDAADDEKTKIEKIVAQAIRPVMEHYGIPGMAVGIVLNGQSYVFDYGVASKATGKPVDSDTLFEIGSVSKTFTATLASYAQIGGQLSLSDPASKYLPPLRGSTFDKVSLLNLGTHTSGGLPLQVPDDITNYDQLMRYFQSWKPTYARRTYRTYSNPSIGLLGVIAAKSMNEDFVALMEGKLFPALGLKNTWLNVPTAQMDHYAQGYTDKDAPVRMTPGVLGPEAYGVRTTSGDLLHFVEANMKMLELEERWQRAITDTHIGYYKIGAMTQDLIWEQYAYPVELKDLLFGNSGEVSQKANPAVKLDPPSPPQDDVLINKTGSTNGFSTYVAFVPARKIGVVLLANKRYPNDARVTFAYRVLEDLR
ncbi:MAG: class C beta-lactamase [Chthoniobacterales bacterium]|nr:MAG: class C beta-lactamase [Chthoniobacterales bacterium]